MIVASDSKEQQFLYSFSGTATLNDNFSHRVRICNTRSVIKRNTWMQHDIFYKIGNTIFQNNFAICNPAILWAIVVELKHIMGLESFASIITLWTFR